MHSLAALTINQTNFIFIALRWSRFFKPPDDVFSTVHGSVCLRHSSLYMRLLHIWQNATIDMHNTERIVVK